MDRNATLAAGPLARLWSDERGATSPAMLILFTTIVAIGGIVGLVSLRDQVVQEMGDIAVALESLNQSWSVDWDGDGMEDQGYEDEESPPDDYDDDANEPPACLEFEAP